MRTTLLLGGNVGDVAATLDKARELIEQRIGRVERASKKYESEAWGFEGQKFVNQIFVVETGLQPEELLDALQGIENELGRDRAAEAEEKQRTGAAYVSRTMDIDILFYGDETIHTPRLTVPHPRIAEREFVQVPLRELGI